MKLIHRGCAFLCCSWLCASATASDNDGTPAITGAKLAELMQLELPEIQKRMESIFELIDRGKDGEIDEDDAKAWTLQLKESMHQHQVQLEFQAIDKDKDGTINLEELLITYADGSGSKSPDSHEAEVKRRFEAVDRNHDGKLNIAEVGLLMDPGKDQVLMQIEIEEIMAAQDKDKDGVISLEEFLSTEGGSLSAQEREDLIKEFSNYDLNSDSKIDEAELQNIIQDPHGHELKSMMESFLKEMVDGKISFSHWKDNFEKYAVSMLTDNGEVLRFPEDYAGLSLPFKGVSPRGRDSDEIGGTDLDDEL